jgi:thiol:disulfide interchange protein
MKRIIFLSLFFFSLLFTASSFAQIQKPATWTYTFSNDQVKKGETVDLIFTAILQNDWYIYSTEFEADGPMPTVFILQPHASFELVGKVKPQNPKEKYDEIWEGKIRYFDNKGIFKQTVKILSDNPVIKGSSEYQTCRHTNGLCVPGNQDFEFKGLKVLAGATTPAKEGVETGSGAVQPSETNPEPSATSDNASQETISNDIPNSDTTVSIISDNSTVPTSTDEDGGNKSLWGFALAAFLSGLVALLTPCVFPIIPMTVSYFTNQENGKVKALLYGISIILIYTLIGTVVSRINGPAFANFLSTHWFPNLLFFAIFFVFGLSFLGLFEIVLPSGFVNKMDARADRGGYAGVFFMAFTLFLHRSNCRKFAGCFGGWRGCKTYHRHGGFFSSICHSIYLVCIVSSMAKIATKIRWVAQYS